MKQIMMRAWEIAREAVEKWGGKVRAYFAEALRQAWAEIKVERLVAKMEAVGFKRWTKNGMDRMYINASRLGLETRTYKSGCISYAAWKGEEISHRRGGALSSAKTYYDLKDGKLHGTEQMLLEAAEELLSSIA